MITVPKEYLTNNPAYREQRITLLNGIQEEICSVIEAQNRGSIDGTSSTQFIHSILDLFQNSPKTYCVTFRSPRNEHHELDCDWSTRREEHLVAGLRLDSLEHQAVSFVVEIYEEGHLLRDTVKAYFNSKVRAWWFDRPGLGRSMTYFPDEEQATNGVKKAPHQEDRATGYLEICSDGSFVLRSQLFSAFLESRIQLSHFKYYRRPNDSNCRPV